MNTRNHRPYWAGFLTGAGLALLAVWVLRQAALIAMDHNLYIFLGLLGLGAVLVGLYLRSPLG